MDSKLDHLTLTNQCCHSGGWLHSGHFASGKFIPQFVMFADNQIFQFLRYLWNTHTFWARCLDWENSLTVILFANDNRDKTYVIFWTSDMFTAN